MSVRMEREEIALRILCALIADKGAIGGSVGENEVRFSFKSAQLFERVSEEVGGRPVLQRAGVDFWNDDDDD